MRRDLDDLLRANPFPLGPIVTREARDTDDIQIYARKRRAAMGPGMDAVKSALCALSNGAPALPLPDAVDAVAMSIGGSSEDGRALVLWMVERGLAHMTSSFQIEFLP